MRYGAGWSWKRYGRLEPEGAHSILKAVASIAILAAAIAPSHASSVQNGKPLSAQICDNISGYGDAGIRSCFALLSDQADDEMQRLYDRILAVLDANDKRRLTGAERKWITYRDNFCAAEHDLYDGATAGLMALPQCRLHLTRNHIDELQSGYGEWLGAYEKAGVPAEQTLGDVRDAVIARLDLNSFPNSTGPRRQASKHSFADYGFSDVEKQAEGSTLYSADRGWAMEFHILSASKQAIKLCLVDHGLKRPQDLRRPSYDARSALIITRTQMIMDQQDYWTAWPVRGGFSDCRNEPQEQ